MIVLGIDPGATTGWVAYDTVTRRAIDSVTGHARAALAVAVAWSLRQQQQQETA